MWVCWYSIHISLCMFWIRQFVLNYCKQVGSTKINTSNTSVTNVKNLLLKYASYLWRKWMHLKCQNPTAVLYSVSVIVKGKKKTIQNLVRPKRIPKNKIYRINFKPHHIKCFIFFGHLHLLYIIGFQTDMHKKICFTLTFWTKII